ncbi:hypothetical protein BDQ12DRAFT_687122 [Crucibulum laeve]|uniref:SET domain-containing protein n=1 Tax=Crucibulum laeve TaxID=68775 RepID=A0A5C3M558_9AGAR|nr:hypothetical protein BDQ12DRAFT_687122 [Crucibulum laeve]
MAPLFHAFEILTTQYGGRGAFVSTSLPRETLVLASDCPYASVIFRKFRKEVCAWCFSYAFESGRSSWKIRVDGAGVWFCSEECKERWVDGSDRGGLRAAVNGAMEKVLGRIKSHTSAGKRNDVQSPLAHLESLQSADVTSDLLDHAWRIAGEVKPNSNPFFESELSEIDLDTAIFLLDGLCRRSIATSPLICRASRHHAHSLSDPYVSIGSWDDLLELQDNELPHTKAKPYILASYIRVYHFVKEVVVVADKSSFVPIAQYLTRLKEYVATPETIRMILARDHGNVFGIWDSAPPGEESEMLGWGLYIFGSYFNHDCTPNLRKSRCGRAMCFTTTSAVTGGDELCINYVDVSDDTTAKDRQDELEKEWFFRCACGRCAREGGVNEATSMPS